MVYLILFFVAGAAIGTQINHAIYRFAYFSRRPISPWMRRHPECSPRKLIDYLPVIGWTSLNREENLFGSLFWLRPLLIELGFGFALAGLYLFHVENQGLLANRFQVSIEWNGWIWFAAHSVLLGLLVVVTFIDFDEFMIPDAITVPGVLFFLSMSIVSPSMALPNISPAKSVEPLTFASPDEWPVAAATHWGLLICIGCFCFWWFAILPKLLTTRLGIKRMFPLMIASILRPARKNPGTLPLPARSMYGSTRFLFGLFLIVVPGLLVAWGQLPDPNRVSLVSAMLGMAFGMGMIWAIRIVGQLALGREAMGFGDVTLMAMIGSCLGWHACLPTLAFGAVAALIITVPMLLIRPESTLPFGPYLSIGAILTVLFWQNAWEGYLKGVLLLFGVQNVLVVLLIMTGLLFVLLLGTRFIRARFFS